MGVFSTLKAVLFSAKEDRAAHLASRVASQKKRHPVWRKLGHCATLMYGGLLVSVAAAEAGNM